MSDLHSGYPRAQGAAEADAVDRGLRRYMLGIYNKVGLGLLLAAAIAYATASVPWLRDLLFRTAAHGGHRATLTFLGSMVAFGPVFLLLGSGFALRKPTPLRSGILYWSVVSLVGASLGVLFLSFTGASIVTTLAVSALGFGGLSLIGYTTDRDLTSLGSFLIMGLVGLVLTLMANWVLGSPAIGYAIGVMGVAIFAGLIAYDTQRLKLTYYEVGGEEASQAIATNFGALSLFINFVNLFQFLLTMVSGQRR